MYLSICHLFLYINEGNHSKEMFSETERESQAFAKYELFLELVFHSWNDLRSHCGPSWGFGILITEYGCL